MLSQASHRIPRGARGGGGVRTVFTEFTNIRFAHSAEKTVAHVESAMYLEPLFLEGTKGGGAGFPKTAAKALDGNAAFLPSGGSLQPSGDSVGHVFPLVWSGTSAPPVPRKGGPEHPFSFQV